MMWGAPAFAQSPTYYVLKDSGNNTFNVLAFSCDSSSRICPASSPVDPSGNPLTGAAGSPSTSGLTVQGMPGGSPVVSTSNGTGAYTGAYSTPSIGTSSAQALPASVASLFLDITNQSTYAVIACAFGQAAVISGAGSFTLQPGASKTFQGSFVPTDALNCISTYAATPATIGVK